MGEPRNALTSVDAHALARVTGAVLATAGAPPDTFWWSSPQVKLPVTGKGPIPVWRGLAEVAYRMGRAMIIGTGFATVGIEGIDYLKARTSSK